MLRNILKIGIRNLVKHPGYAVINISGLAVGIACCLLIMLYVRSEFSYDTYHEKAERTYRLLSKFDFSGQNMTLPASNFVEAAAYTENIPEVEAFSRLESEAGIARKGDQFLNEGNLIYADPALFQILDFDVLAGNLGDVLQVPNTVVITREIAERYFDDTQVVGEQLHLNLEESFEAFTIEAVIENHPGNSSFDFDMVFPWQMREAQLSEYRMNSWSNISLNSLLLLRADADVEAVLTKMRELRITRSGEDEWAQSIENLLQPITEMHLETGFDGSTDGVIDSSAPRYSYVLSAIALIILIVASINFTNLSVARSFPRAREIGVRKVLGAGKRIIAFQFLTEAFFMCLIAFVLGLLISEFTLPVFEQLTQKRFSQGLLEDPLLVASSFGLVLLTALLSGFYPAFVVSRFNVLRSLKGGIKVKGKNYVSRSLLVLQFAIAAVLIITALAMNRQIGFMIDMDLGYDDSNLVRINTRGTGVNNLANLFKNELAANPNIVQVAAADGYDSATGLRDGDHEFISIFMDVDDRYLDLLKVQLLEGRELKKGEDIFLRPGEDGATDTLTNVVVNEAFVKRAAWEDPINRTVGNVRVVGILKDFHFGSVRGEVEPVMFMPSPDNPVEPFSYVYVKFRPEFLPQIKTTLEEVWRKHVPFKPFAYDFMEESNANQYEEEARWKTIISYTSLLAILISALGLFGMAHLSTQQRTKEVGIRKVLGASLSSILVLLGSDFAKLVLLSVVLSVPLAFYTVDAWLQGFSNRIPMSWLLFLLPGLITFSVAAFTIGLQSVKTARSNPIEAIRYE